MHVRAAVLCAAAAAATTSALPIARAHPIPKPGSYERTALDHALQARSLTLDPRPRGKRIGRIHVVNLEVFSPKDGRWLTWLNWFHRVSRERHVRREVLLLPGATWNEELVEETERNLRDPIFTTLVIIAPVRSRSPGMVDLLVVTRDVWSLRFNSRFELQEGKLTELSLSFSENNFLGWRKQVALVFNMNQGDYDIGPLYVDKNIAGTRVRLRTDAAAIFGRATGDLEGSRVRVLLDYPLWSLHRKWGANVSVRHKNSITREFLGTQLRQFDAEATAEDDAIGWEYRRRTLDLELGAVRSMGDQVLHRVTSGWRLGDDRSAVLDSFPENPVVQSEFEREILPRSERSSTVFARYRMFTPRYRSYRDIKTYDLSEDVQLGPDVTAEVSASTRLLGSTTSHYNASARARWTVDWRRDGYVRASAGAAGRLQGRDLLDNRVDASLRVVSPRIARLFRVVAQAAFSARIDEQSNRFLTLGGSNGLRGYPISWFLGQVRALANVELRSMPVALGFTRVGGLVFWDAGHAATSVGALRFHHDVGLGLRALIPQLSPLIYRLDWALPLSGSASGLPGRITAGVSQVF